MSVKKDKRVKYLLLGLLLDLIGMSSLLIPGIGDFLDVIWAPIAGWLMTRMYKGRIGQAAGVVTFIEELVPGLDIIPTFTIMWVYTYLLSGKKAKTTNGWSSHGFEIAPFSKRFLYFIRLFIGYLCLQTHFYKKHHTWKITYCSPQ